MKCLTKLAIGVMVLLLSSDTIVSSVKGPAYKKRYRLVFRDEFNGTKGSSVNSKYWSVPERKKYMWARQISNVRNVYNIANGTLICKAIPNTVNQKDTAEMLTCAFSTKDKFEFKYGKVVVRLRTSNTEGNFPAVWLLPADQKNAPYRYGEIDIFETFGNDGKAHQTVHNHRTFALGRKENNAFPHSLDMTQWHVYGVEWTPTSIMFTIDGKTMGYYEKSKDEKELAEGQWTFDRPYYIVVNQSTGQKGWHEPDVNHVYQTEVDWIRVYQ